MVHENPFGRVHALESQLVSLVEKPGHLWHFLSRVSRFYRVFSYEFFTNWRAEQTDEMVSNSYSWRPIATPRLPFTQMRDAVVIPRTVPICRKTTPAPRKTSPVITLALTLADSLPNICPATTKLVDPG